EPMARMGWCPSGRLFEAAACGTPILTDDWAGLDQFFTPGEEILVADTRGDTIAALSLSDDELQRIARAARDRGLSEHTSLVRAGADKVCFVISPHKADIVSYFAGTYGGTELCYVVQERPGGLCEAVFRAAPLIDDDEQVLVGLPDTIWFPVDGLSALPDDVL